MDLARLRCRYGSREFFVFSKRLAAAFLTFAVWVCAATPANAVELTPADFSSTTQYAHVLRTFNPRLSETQSRAYADHVRTEAQYYRLDARLLVALVAIESSWHPYATSPVGAGGLGQLMPGTAAGLGVDAYSPYANLSGTAHYLRTLLDRYSDYEQSKRYSFALAGYNAGPGAVTRYNGIPPYTETQNYVRNVMGIWRELSLSLSSHIDDYVRTPAYTRHPRHAIVLATQAPAPKKRAHQLTQQHPQATQTTIVATAISPPEPAKKRPLLYYVFHRHHPDAQQIAAANAPMGSELLLNIPPSVQAVQPITVLLNPSEKPVMLMAFLGKKLVAHSRMPAYTTRAVISGLQLNGVHAPFTLIARL